MIIYISNIKKYAGRQKLWFRYWTINVLCDRTSSLARTPRTVGVVGASRLPGDDERLAEAVSARLWLTFHHGCRARKGFDCESLCRLHAKGPSADPVGRAKSVVLAWF
ncbi:DUF6429 family protein [Methylobacterium sp. CM6246]